MSKLEDKLSASIKPKRAQSAKPASDKPATPPRTKPAPGAADADLNAPSQPLHPRRIWPD